MKQVLLRVDDDVKKRIKHVVIDKEITMNKLINDVIISYLNRYEESQKK